jgi:hypothetical protein
MIDFEISEAPHWHREYSALAGARMKVWTATSTEAEKHNDEFEAFAKTNQKALEQIVLDADQLLEDEHYVFISIDFVIRRLSSVPIEPLKDSLR